MVAVSGGILVFLGLFPVLGALVALVPLPVLGGAGLALFGTVAASGIRTLSRVDFSGNANIVIVAFAIGMGIIPIAVPTFYDKFPEWFQVIFDSGITAAAITAVAAEHRLQHRRPQQRRRGPDLRRGPGARGHLPRRRGQARPERAGGPGPAPAGEPVIRLHRFNQLDAAAAAALVRPCLDVDRWVTDIVSRPPLPRVGRALRHRPGGRRPVHRRRAGSRPGPPPADRRAGPRRQRRGRAVPLGTGRSRSRR